MITSLSQDGSPNNRRFDRGRPYHDAPNGNPKRHCTNSRPGGRGTAPSPGRWDQSRLSSGNPQTCLGTTQRCSRAYRKVLRHSEEMSRPASLSDGTLPCGLFHTGGHRNNSPWSRPSHRHSGKVCAFPPDRHTPTPLPSATETHPFPRELPTSRSVSARTFGSRSTTHARLERSGRRS